MTVYRISQYLLVLATCVALPAVSGAVALDSPQGPGQDDSTSLRSVATAPQTEDLLWPGSSGAPLPFTSYEGIEEFLRTAEVVGREDIPVGVTGPIKVTLERDGVRAHAVFRHFKHTYQRARMRDGRLRVNLIDSYAFEPAAYALARMLGMDCVPPAVERRISGRRGSLQIWVYDAVMQRDLAETGVVRLHRPAGDDRADRSPPDAVVWARRLQMMTLFDVLIGNDDRNGGNLLIDPQWKVWLIDHTRSFYGRARSRGLDSVIFVNRGFWQRLQQLEKDQLHEALGSRSRRRSLAGAAESGRLSLAQRRRATHVGSRKRRSATGGRAHQQRRCLLEVCSPR